MGVPQHRQAFHLRPGRAVVEGLAELCRDPRNIVFVVSGRGKDELQDSFGHIQVGCITCCRRSDNFFRATYVDEKTHVYYIYGRAMRREINRALCTYISLVCDPGNCPHTHAYTECVHRCTMTSVDSKTAAHETAVNETIFDEKTVCR